MTAADTIETRKRQAFELARAARLPEAEALLRRVLTEAPDDLSALLLFGDVLHAGRKQVEASQAYRVAVTQAERLGLSRAKPYEASLARAIERLGGYTDDYSAMIDTVVPKGARSERFNQSIDILLGRSVIYLQQPTKYYFPGLPQAPVYPREQFPWAAALEAETANIREELRAVMARDGAFAPYLPAGASRPQARSHRLVGDPAWSAFYLWKDGVRQEANCALCPKTAAAMDQVPLDHLPGQAPSVLFSLLKPGAHIPPHHGLINTRLICHLPLIVPGPAWLRVGHHTHHWKEGELLVFDDSFEHEALNEAEATRVVLLFDVWRPELNEQERREVAALIGAISAAGGMGGEA